MKLTRSDQITFLEECLQHIDRIHTTYLNEGERGEALCTLTAHRLEGNADEVMLTHRRDAQRLNAIARFFTPKPKSESFLRKYGYFSPEAQVTPAASGDSDLLRRK